MSIWMPVIDEMLSLFVNWHNIDDPFAVAVHVENSLVFPNLLSRSVFIACSISTGTNHLS